MPSHLNIIVGEDAIYQYVKQLLSTSEEVTEYMQGTYKAMSLTKDDREIF